MNVTRMLPFTACIRFTLNQTVDLFIKNLKISKDKVYLLPQKTWKKYLTNEENERVHFVRVYDPVRGVSCITTAYQQSHRGSNMQTVDLTNQMCPCEK